MKLKKIVFSVFCAALLLCAGVVCLASADNEGISTHDVSTYNDGDVVYNDVRLRAYGASAAPASLSQIVNPYSTKKTYFGEVDVSRYNLTTKRYEDSDGDNTIINSGKTLTGDIAQIRNGVNRYEHYAVLHIGTVSVSPIVATLERSYAF